MRLLDRLPPVLRHGPAFWRRSVQARVVVSTVLLSAAVVGVVGWFLIQQTRDGLLENRVDAVVQEAEGETVAARAGLAARPPRRRRVRPAAGARRADPGPRCDPRLRRGAVATGQRGRTPRRRRREVHRGPRPQERAGEARGTLRRASRRPRGPTPTSAPRARSPASRRAPASWWAARSGSRPTTTPTRSTTSTPSPSSRRRWRWSRAPCSSPASRCCSSSPASPGW